MKQRKLGAHGLVVSAIGLGCSGMSGDYGVPDDVEFTATIHRAIDLGLNLFDTSDAYSAGKNEELLGRAIKGRRNGLIIASKFGNVRGPNGERGGVNGKPEYIPVACEASLKRLGIDVIDLYYQHRVDPGVPIEDTVGAMSRLVEQGKVRYLGLCEAGPTPSGARMRCIRSRRSRPSTRCGPATSRHNILPVIRTLGVGLVPYCPLGRGFLSGGFAQPRRPDPDRPAARPSALPGGQFRAEPQPARDRSRRSPAPRAAPWRRSRSPGCCRAATTSCRSPAPSAALIWSRTSPRPTSR